MSKKTLSVVIMLVLAAGAFAEDFAAGVSVTGGYSIGVQKASLDAPAVTSQSVDMSLPVAASIFGDFGLVSVGFGISAEVLRSQAVTQTVDAVVTPISSASTGTRIFFTLSLLAELPLDLGALTLVPLAGLEGDFCISALDATGTETITSMTAAQRADLHEGWIKAGAELRIPLAAGASLRPWFLAGYKLLNDGETTVLGNLQTAGFHALLLGLRAQAGLAVGFGL